MMVFGKTQMGHLAIVLILGETYTNLELLMEDDTSTDNVPEHFVAWARTVRRYACTKVIGPSRNFGTLVAKDLAMASCCRELILLCTARRKSFQAHSTVKCASYTVVSAPMPSAAAN